MGERREGAAGGHGPGIDGVDELVLLRTTVESWTKIAFEALLKFRRESGSFWKDSKGPKAGEKEPPHITTSARAYMALVQADRRRDTSDGNKVPEWAASLRRFMSSAAIGRKERHFNEVKPKKKPGRDGLRDKYEVNTFDIAHLASFFQVSTYLARFYGEAIPVDTFFDAPNQAFEFENNEKEPEGCERKPAHEYDVLAAEQAIKERLREALKEAANFDHPSIGFPGEVCFEEDRPESRHYFATLHALRALHILQGKSDGKSEETKEKQAKAIERDSEWLEKVVAGARSFAIEQCHYFERETTHRQDPVRLAFAGCIYAIYGEHIDKDLCMAIVEALAAAQQPNGSWPATHPVFRQDNVPWHIASHEVALCLTWLYFQPRVPDAARPLLIDMMRKYLLSAVIPTFLRANSRSGATESNQGGEAKQEGEAKATRLHGWQDDHTVSPDTTLGWATAVVCHFLASFEQVLDDWVNRRVIEELGLKLITAGYLIDDTASKPSRRWSRDEHNPSPVWPDLPPRAWAQAQPEAARQKQDLAYAWTDPTYQARICGSLAKKVLQPIHSHPSEQPGRYRCAGLMPGDPGTRKTSLVKEIASILGWPMVAVPASSIFEKGFDMMEARANEVFGLLNHLRRCVIFFDEFEEFFVMRPEGSEKSSSTGGKHGSPNIDYGNRTIAAFTTAAMLPRLQDLHDTARCLIFLATNHIDRIDPAIKREGRFDFTITVPHPKVSRLIQYLQGDLPKKTLDSTGLSSVSSHETKRVVEIVSKALERLGTDSQRKRLKFRSVERQLSIVAADVSSGKKDPDMIQSAKDALILELGAKTPEAPPELTAL